MTFCIGVLGSSGTAGAGIPRERAWPGQLEGICARAGYDVKVHNFASDSLPVAAIAERVLYIHETLRPDLYLLQLPHSSRSYFGVNGYGVRREKDLPEYRIYGWNGPLDAGHGPSPTRLFINQSMATPGSPAFPLLERYHLPKVVANNPNALVDRYIDFALFWGENVCNSDLQHVQHGKEVVMLQWLFERMDVAYRMFDWSLYNVYDDDRLGRFGDLIDFDRFLGQGQLNVFDFLREQGVDMEARQIDGYGHLDEEGHRLVAELFIAPSVLDYLSRGAG